MLVRKMPMLLKKSTGYVLILIQFAAFSFMLKKGMDKYEMYKEDEIFMKADYMVQKFFLKSQTFQLHRTLYKYLIFLSW